jgi:glycosyltransferase involved in cell wall biosynthesis
MNRIRVLWVSHFVPYPPKGGVLQRGFGLVSAVAKELDLHLFCFHQPRLMAQTLGASVDALPGALKALTSHSVSIRTARIPSEQHQIARYAVAASALVRRKSFTGEWLRSRLASEQLCQYIEEIRPDVVHLDTVSLAHLIDIVPAATAITLGHHNVESHMMWRRAKTAPTVVQRAYLRYEAGRLLALEASVVSRVQSNVVCSRLDGRRLQKLHGAQNWFIAENGVPNTLTSVSSPWRREPRFVFVGRMSAYTNRQAALELADEIWPALSACFPDATLDVIGAAPPRSLVELARRDPRVFAHGFVSDLDAVISPGMTFLCPIRTGGGTKLKVLDAMHRGWPVVAHPVALEGLEATPLRHYLPACTPAEYVAAVKSMIAGPNMVQALTDAARDLVMSKYSFDSIGKKLAGHFVDVSRASRALPSRSVSVK